MSSEDTRWIIGPPGPGEVAIHLAVDEHAQLTPELRQAIDGLVEALHQDEVAGYGEVDPRVRRIVVCDPKGSCRPRSTQPCAVFETCRITSK